MHDENNLKVASWIAARFKGVISPVVAETMKFSIVHLH